MTKKFSLLIRFLFVLTFIMGVFGVESSFSRPIEIVVCTPSKANSLNARAINKFAQELEKRAPG